MLITKELYLALYVIVDEHNEEVGKQAFAVYAEDYAELNERIDNLAANTEKEKQYADVLELTHGLVLVDGNELPATITVRED